MKWKRAPSDFQGKTVALIEPTWVPSSAQPVKAGPRSCNIGWVLMCIRRGSNEEGFARECSWWRAHRVETANLRSVFDHGAHSKGIRNRTYLPGQGTWMNRKAPGDTDQRRFQTKGRNKADGSDETTLASVLMSIRHERPSDGAHIAPYLNMVV